MRIFKSLTILFIVVMISAACDALPLLSPAATSTHTRQPTWTRVPSQTPSITPTKTIRPTKTITPSPTITRTRLPSHTPINIRSNEQPGLADTEAITATLGISYLQVKNILEPLGFIFPETATFDNNESVSANYPAIPMDLVLKGSIYNLIEVSLEFSIQQGDLELTKIAASMMQHLVNLILPGWDESYVWLLDSIQEGLVSDSGSYENSSQRSGVFIQLNMDRLSGETKLTLYP